MMSYKIFGFSGILCLLMACSLEVAKPPKNRKVILYTDQYTPLDSTIIHDFELYSKIKVQVVYKEPHVLNAIVTGNKYDVGYDLIITKSDTLRQLLKDREMLYKINNTRLFRNINRQFNNNHYLWLPICHNPLLLAVKLDSLSSCSTMNWSKHFKDSSGLQLKISQQELDYYQTLEKANSRYETILKSKNKPFSNGILIKLDDFLRSKTDRRYKDIYCVHLLNERGHVYTQTTSISINKYARNKAEAITFLNFFGKFAYQIASNRNQISTFNGIISNYRISELQLYQ